MPFRIIRSNINNVKADAVVNTADPDAAGLDAKHIIHAGAPRWTDGTKGEKESLRSCLDKALRTAKELGCSSVAFPFPIAAINGFPKELEIQIAVDAFTAFLKENDIEITLAVFGGEDVSVSGKLAEDIAGFIDDKYAENASAGELWDDNGPRATDDRREVRADSAFHSVLNRSFLRKERGACEEISCDLFALEDAEIEADETSEKKSESLEDSLKEIYKHSFEKYLQQLINRKGLKNSEVYAAANISKQYFSKLLKGQVKPSKEKMLALAVGLRLNLDETIDFLRFAGYALSPISQTDKIVEYFIEQKDYNVLKIDIVLFDYGLDPLSNQQA